MRRVAILGGGPVGLEAALAAREHGWTAVLYEQSPTVAGNVRAWGHVRLFTPWDWNVSPRMRFALGASAPSGAALPTGRELADELLEPVARGLDVRTGVQVLGIAREGLLKHEKVGSAERAARPFRLHLLDGTGRERFAAADVVIDATGTYGSPNRLGDGGIDALGERALDARIARAMPEAATLAGRDVLLTGAGHSAQTAARDLTAVASQAPETHIIWAVRSHSPTWGAVADDPLPARAALTRAARDLAGGACKAVQLHTGCTVLALVERDGRIAVTLREGEDEREVLVDHVLALNGGSPDASIYRQLQVHECYATAAPMKLAAALLGEDGGDCLAPVSHGPETLRNPEPGFFILGAKSYGRNPTFLLRVGWQQVDDVFGSLLGTPGHLAAEGVGSARVAEGRVSPRASRRRSRRPGWPSPAGPSPA
ncbi:MAG: FAD-dependent oxidoreductase [Solirubrobacteraceae bacterium]